MTVGGDLLGGAPQSYQSFGYVGPDPLGPFGVRAQNPLDGAAGNRGQLGNAIDAQTFLAQQHKMVTYRSGVDERFPPPEGYRGGAPLIGTAVGGATESAPASIGNVGDPGAVDVRGPGMFAIAADQVSWRSRERLGLAGWAAVIGCHQQLGVTKNRAMQVSKKSDFPAPVAELSVGRIWSYEAVVEFCERTGRKVHPLKPAVTADADVQLDE
jgi:hypothetical protein